MSIFPPYKLVGKIDMVTSPPAQRTSAIEWDEFVGLLPSGLIERNTARLGPKRHTCPR